MVPNLGTSPRLGFLVAKVLADHTDLGENLSVVQPESWNVALRVYLPVITAVGGLFVRDIDLLKIEGISGFTGNDVRGHGASARSIVELHAIPFEC
jgi:hypothetical protein